MTKNLSREDKLKLLLALEEKKDRLKKAGKVFTPHKGQMHVVLSEAQERFVFCANAFGKSSLLVNEVHWAATGVNPYRQSRVKPPARIVLVLDQASKADNFLNEYKKWNYLDPKWLSKRGTQYYCEINYPNGSYVRIMSHQQETLVAEGIELDYLFADEPCPRDLFIALTRGGRTKGRKLQVLLCGTPLAQAWMREQIYEPWAKGELPDTMCFSGSSADNKENLEEGFLEKFASRLSTAEREVRMEGKFFDLGGLALAHLFKEATHTVPKESFVWNNDWPVTIAIDPHPSKAHVACAVGVDRDNQLYYLAELSSKSTARDFARQLKEWYRNWRVVNVVCDSLGSADTTGGEGFKSFIDVLKEEGIPLRSTSWDEKNDEEFINRIQTSLELPATPNNFGQIRPKLLIVDSNYGIISNIRNAEWKRGRGLEDIKPKIDISKLDYLACLKYALATNPKISHQGNEPYYVQRPVYGMNWNGIRRSRR